MSIAFPAVLLFLLVLPGLLFRRGFLRPPVPNTSLTDEIAWAVIPAIGFHLLAILLVESTSHYRIDFKTLGLFLAGAQTDAAITSDFNDLGQYLGPIAIYNLMLWLASFTIGGIVGRVVARNDWDRRYVWLKRSDDWRDLVEGRLVKAPGEFDFVSLDALVNCGSATIIYSGIMQTFIYSADGSIEAVIFLKAQKLMTIGTSQPILIPGAAFAVKFSEILNLNVSFVRLPDTP